MTDKFVDVVGGKKTLKTPVQTSAGAADAGKVVALNSTGLLDPSMVSATHTQSVPATIWTFNHNLGRRPNIMVRDSAGTVIKTRVEHVSENQALIKMSYAVSGTAYAS